MIRQCKWIRWPVLMALAGTSLLVGCSARGGVSIVDAQTAVQVKTALVNDATVGTLPIDVQAHGGMVTLVGTVRSAVEVDQALAVVRAVPGVVSARSALKVNSVPAARVVPSNRLPALAPEPESSSRWVAAGVSWTRMKPSHRILASATSLGPILRMRPGSSGFGPSFGFDWFEGKLQAGDGMSPLAALRAKPVMAGGQYQFVKGRFSAGATVVAGYSFNSLAVDQKKAASNRAIAVTNSFAWRPGGWVWYDLFPKVGLNVVGGYLFTTPELTVASDDSVSSRQVKASTAILKVGIAYWIF